MPISRADAFYSIGKYKECIADYDIALKVFRNIRTCNKAWALNYLGGCREAEKSFDDFIKDVMAACSQLVGAAAMSVLHYTSGMIVFRAAIRTVSNNYHSPRL